MKRMTFASMTALRAALMNLAEKPPGNALIYGRKGAQRTFCKSVNILRNIKRLCSCSRLEMRINNTSPGAHLLWSLLVLIILVLIYKCT